jgi:hypothetical protein
VQTRANSLETRIVLNGVHDHELPLSVFGWIQGQIISPHQHLLVIGPSAWSKRVLSVRLPRYPTMLVACSRSGLRISQDAIAGSDHEASVRFVPAARVDITWIPARMSTGVMPIIEVKSENRVDCLAMARQVIQGSGPSRGGFTTSAYLRTGDAEFICFDSASRRELWRRALDVDRDRMELRIEEGRQ